MLWKTCYSIKYCVVIFYNFIFLFTCPQIEASSTPYPPAPTPSCISGQYSPDPSDCSRFFFCVNGRPINQKCANGLQWNSDKDYCDWPFNVACANNKYLSDGKLKVLLWMQLVKILIKYKNNLNNILLY
jgi:hypothetical protein